MRIERGGIGLNVEVSGPEDGAPVLFLHALGTDLTLWDEVVTRLPDGLRLIRADMRGHGRSDVPPAPYSMGALVHDAEAVLEGVGAREAVVVGLSIGGMIAQGLAAKRFDLVRGLVLSNTAARIGTRAQWEDRIAAVREGGVAALAEATLDRWFGPDHRHGPLAEHWGAKLRATSPEGYMGCAAAIAGTDFWTTTAALRLPTLGIAGSEDGSTPPDLVRETVDLIPGSRFVLMRRSGHLPAADAPDAFAGHLTQFFKEIGHG